MPPMGLARLFLALIVAADHWRVIQLAPLGITFEDFYKLGFNSGYAVMFFYVISGFLITFTLTRDYARDLARLLRNLRGTQFPCFSSRKMRPCSGGIDWARKPKNRASQEGQVVTTIPCAD
jgi:hypothetical protein